MLLLFYHSYAVYYLSDFNIVAVNARFSVAVQRKVYF